MHLNIEKKICKAKTEEVECFKRYRNKSICRVQYLYVVFIQFCVFLVE